MACLDLQSGWKVRMHLLPWFLLMWLLMLPIDYVVLWKISLAEREPEEGSVSTCLGMPGSREAARQALRTFHLWLLLLAGVVVLVILVARSLSDR